MAAKAATTFPFCIKRLDLAGLNDGMVVCPGLFEAMRQQFDGLGAVGIPDEEASCGCAKSANHPKNISHFIDLLPSDAGCWKYDARCETDAGKFCCAAGFAAETFMGVAGAATL
jgi:hypothetical protein